MDLVARAKIELVRSRVPLIRGRDAQATLHALVLPMLDALGYDLPDPASARPHLHLALDGLRVHVEVVAVDQPVGGRGPTSDAALAVRTNGAEYRFHAPDHPFAVHVHHVDADEPERLARFSRGRVADTLRELQAVKASR